MINKSYLLAALILILIVSGGIYAYTYPTGLGIIGTPAATGDIATVNATASQPDWDSILTTVNEDIILRPDAAGDATNIKEQYPATGEHWDKVDEASSDNDTTYLHTPDTNYQEDLYATDNHSSQTAGGGIQDVEVFMVSRVEISAEQVSAYVHIKTNGSEYDGPSENLTTGYAPYSYLWIENPQTGSSWTWSEIDELQTGIGMRKAGASIASRCTQVYTNVNFDAPELTGSTPIDDLFEITVHPGYDGNLQVRVYLTNTADLMKAYDYLDIRLYLESSQEAGETPSYQLMNLQSGVAVFNLVDISGGSYTLSVIGGTYQLRSRHTAEWEAGWTVTPEFYCEATQR